MTLFMYFGLETVKFSWLMSLLSWPVYLIAEWFSRTLKAHKAHMEVFKIEERDSERLELGIRKESSHGQNSNKVMPFFKRASELR